MAKLQVLQSASKRGTEEQMEVWGSTESLSGGQLLQLDDS